MLLSYLKIAIRNLVRHKLYTIINVSGLAIGIAFCILIILFVQQELSFDSFHQNGDTIYRVVTTTKSPNGELDRSAFQPMPLIPALIAEFPEIKNGVRFTTGSSIVKYEDKVFDEQVMFTDPAVFDVFTFPLIAGNPSTALRDPDNLVLTETMAKKYFGDQNPMGKRLVVTIRGTTHEMSVTGIARDLPPNSSFKIDFLLSITKNSMYERAKDRWTSANGSAFIQLEDNTTPLRLEQKFAPFIAKHFGAMIERERKDDEISNDADAYRIALQPLADIHLDTETGSSPEPRSNPTYSWILAGIGFFVLLIACINFTTLAIGRSASRAREVGVRKVLGAARSQVMKQFWGEAFLLCFVALALGLVLAEVALPSFNRLTTTKLALSIFTNAWLVISLTGLLIFVGLIAGSYPAAFLSRFEPVEIFKGKIRLGGRSMFSAVLIVIQFGLSIVLVIGSFVMSDQLSFILRKDLGYNAEQVVVVQMYPGPGNPADVLVERFRTTLAANPHILSVSGTSGAFSHGYDRNGFKHRGVNRNAFVYRIDELFLTTLGIPLKEGRNFNSNAPGEKQQAILVNEALVREFGWEEPIVGTRLDGWNEKELPGGPIVIGVVKDFNFESLKDAVNPAILFMNPDWPMDQAVVKIAATNVAATMEELRTAWNTIAPGKPFGATFLDDDVQKQYEAERRWQTIVNFASSFAIALACLGLFGLATLTVANRTKEIGIRKVLGASVSRILFLLSKEFARLVVVSNAIAWPIAYYFAREWLNSFAYRIELGAWVFFVSGGAALAIALITVSVQAIRAALANPIDALKYE